MTIGVAVGLLRRVVVTVLVGVTICVERLVPRTHPRTVANILRATIAKMSQMILLCR